MIHWKKWEDNLYIYNYFSTSHLFFIQDPKIAYCLTCFQNETILGKPCDFVTEQMTLAVLSINRVITDCVLCCSLIWHNTMTVSSPPTDIMWPCSIHVLIISNFKWTWPNFLVILCELVTYQVQSGVILFYFIGHTTWPCGIPQRHITGSLMSFSE